VRLAQSVDRIFSNKLFACDAAVIARWPVPILKPQSASDYKFMACVVPPAGLTLLAWQSNLILP